MSLPDLLAPVRALITGLLAAVHDQLAALGLAAGPAWLLGVVALVVVVRTALLPLAVRQFRSARRQQALAPELRRVQQRYRGRRDRAGREALARETAELYRSHGVHPLGALVPALIQIPVFLALIQALEAASRGAAGPALASFAAAAVLGAPLAATALSGGWPAALVGGGLLLATAGAQVLTQHLATVGATEVPGGRLLLLLPLATALAGLAFPIGVTAYWCSSALWTLGQQVALARLLRT